MECRGEEAASGESRGHFVMETGIVFLLQINISTLGCMIDLIYSVNFLEKKKVQFSK